MMRSKFLNRNYIKPFGIISKIVKIQMRPTWTNLELSAENFNKFFTKTVPRTATEIGTPCEAFEVYSFYYLQTSKKPLSR